MGRQGWTIHALHAAPAGVWRSLAAVESVAISWATTAQLHPACGLSAAVDKVACCLFSPSSKHYPLYSLNVASMWLKLGRLYMGLENKAAGERALKKVCVWCEVRRPSAWRTPHTSLPAGLRWLTESWRKTSPWLPTSHRSGRGVDPAGGRVVTNWAFGAFASWPFCWERGVHIVVTGSQLWGRGYLPFVPWEATEVL